MVVMELVCMVLCDGKYLGYLAVEFGGVLCLCEGGQHLFLHVLKIGGCIALAEFNAAYFEFVVGKEAIVTGESADAGLFTREEDDPAVACFDVHAYAGVITDEAGKMYGACG